MLRLEPCAECYTPVDADLAVHAHGLVFCTDACVEAYEDEVEADRLLEDERQDGPR